MKQFFYSILSTLMILFFTGCSKDGQNGQLDGTVWVRSYSYYSDYFKTTTNYKNTLRFASTTFTIELYSDYSSSPGIYSTITGIYDTSDYPNVLMVDDDGDVEIVVIDGSELTRDGKIYYKQ